MIQPCQSTILEHIKICGDVKQLMTYFSVINRHAMTHHLHETFYYSGSMIRNCNSLLESL